MGVQISEFRTGCVYVYITPTAVSAQSTNEQTFTVPGLKVGDFVEIQKPTHTSGVTFGNVRVSAANTMAIQFINPTTGSVTPTAEQYLVFWFRPEFAPGSQSSTATGNINP
jgi:hypothetical protein